MSTRAPSAKPPNRSRPADSDSGVIVSTPAFTIKNDEPQMRGQQEQERSVADQGDREHRTVCRVTLVVVRAVLGRSL